MSRGPCHEIVLIGLFGLTLFPAIGAVCWYTDHFGAFHERLAQVLDPELDESILDLGFVRSLELRSGHADVARASRHRARPLVSDPH